MLVLWSDYRLKPAYCATASRPPLRHIVIVVVVAAVVVVVVIIIIILLLYKLNQLT